MSSAGSRRAKPESWVSVASLIISVLAIALSITVAYPNLKAFFFPDPSCDDKRGLSMIKGRSADATTELPEEEGHTYLAKNAIDGDTKTAWIPEGGDGGAGQKITLWFQGEVDLQLVCAVNGYAIGEDLYERNARIGNLTVETKAGSITGSLQNYRRQSMRDVRGCHCALGGRTSFGSP